MGGIKFSLASTGCSSLSLIQFYSEETDFLFSLCSMSVCISRGPSPPAWAWLPLPAQHQDLTLAVTFASTGFPTALLVVCDSRQETRHLAETGLLALPKLRVVCKDGHVRATETSLDSEETSVSLKRQEAGSRQS